MKREEKRIASALAKWLFSKHRDQVWRLDSAADMKMTIGQARQNKILNPHRGYPDFFLLNAKSGFNGLYIEIKTSSKEVYKLNGEIRKNLHIQEQDFMLRILEKKGYKAVFGFGLNHCKEIIENYLKLT